MKALLLEWLHEAKWWDNCCDNFSPNDPLDSHEEWCLVRRSLVAVGLTDIGEVPEPSSTLGGDS